MLSSVEQVFVGRYEKWALLKTPAWEATPHGEGPNLGVHSIGFTVFVTIIRIQFKTLRLRLRINIPKWKQEAEIDLSDKRCVWDWIKYNIRLHAISYSKEKAKLEYEKEQRIQQDFKDANRLFENDPSASNRLWLDEVKEKLELFYEEKVKGVVIRASTRWHEYGERSTKYFLNLEKRNHVKIIYYISFNGKVKIK